MSIDKLYLYLLKIIVRLKACYFKVSPKSKAPNKGLFAGLVGCGNFARYAYIPALNRKQMPIVISGLYSNSHNSSKKAQGMLRYKTRIFFSYEELLNSGIKGVILTLPNHLHYQYIIKALESGVDVFCEKPVTNSLNDAMRLNRYLDTSRNILMVGFNQRYLDRMKKVKSFIENNGLGEIYEVSTFHNQDIAGHLEKSSWLNDSKKSGGGILYNAGIHLVNLMLYFFGPIESVFARLECKKMPKVFGEDSADCDFYFKSGVKGKLKASYINEVDSSYEHLIIKGSRGTIYTDMKTSSIMYKSNNSLEWVDIPCKRELVPDSVFNELSHFCHCMEKRMSPDTGISDSIDTLNVMEAAYLSSLDKRRISVDEAIIKYEKN